MNGFFFANPAGLWGLAAVGAVAVLYLFGRSRRPLPITGLFLWETPHRRGMGGRRLEPPPPGRSLLLDALAAAGFALALADPALRIGVGPLRIIVLDDAFSMRAREGHRQALRLAERLLIDADEAGAGAAVILAGDRESILSGPGTPLPEALAALSERYLPSSAASSWRKAVTLARDRYGENLEFRVIGNREIPADAGGGRLWFHIVPGWGGNLAFGRIWRLSGENPGE
ncbi:MAG: BatA domain-containing protein, partial [Planctomycetota bacterium]|nr:BatA domain-containing protein [Planctomycetota bacterium]